MNYGVYTTKFFKVGMFKRFGIVQLNGTVKKYTRVGRNLYEDSSANTRSAITSLGTNVVQVEDDYYWTTP